jgi:aminoglycoside 3-N-acetyltransferase
MGVEAAGPALGRSHLVSQLLDLGVRPGGVLLVHTSFRGVRPVEGGPAGLIEALRVALGPDGTLVMPSWSGSNDEPFVVDRTPADASLGVVPETFRRMPDVLRSDHQHAFAAAGPAAAKVLRDPLPLPPHGPASPAGRVHDLDGQVLLLGVGHDADTTIHLAEILAGVPYRVAKHCTISIGGEPRRIEYGENDHCCARFKLVDGWLGEAGRQRHGPVGHAEGRLARSRDIVDVVVQRLRREPLLFLHDTGAGCEACDEARASVPGA